MIHPLLPSLSLGAVLLATTAAWAHSPHDGTAFVAMSPGESPAWLSATISRDEGWFHARLPYGAQEPQTRFIGRDGLVITSGVWVSEQRMILGALSGLLTSEDAGDSFAPSGALPGGSAVHAMAVPRDVAVSGRVLGVGEAPMGDGIDGIIWVSSDHGASFAPALLIPDDPVQALRLAPDGVTTTAGTLAGSILTSADGGASWTQRGSVPAAIWDVCSGDVGEIWAATDGRGLWRSIDGGQAFTQVAFPTDRITAVVDLGGGLVLAALPMAMWRSDDDGATWSESGTGLQRPFVDQPDDGLHYLQLEAAPDGSVWLGGWEGVARSTDMGLTWTRFYTYLPSNLRDAAVSLSPDGVPQYLFALNGGGIEWVDLEGGRAGPVGLLMERPWPRHIAAGATWDRAAVLAATLSEGLATSFDAGLHWTMAAQREDQGFLVANDVDVQEGPDGQPWIFGAGTVDGHAGWCIVHDRGFSACSNLPDIVPPQTCDAIDASPTFAQDGQVWIVCADDGQIRASTDWGVTFNLVGNTHQPSQAIQVSPGGERVFIATEDGLLASDKGSAPFLLAFEDEVVLDLAVSPSWDSDPVIYALVPREGWFRSEDGGSSFDPLPAPTLEVPLGIDVSPAFGTDGVVSVSTSNGAWVSTDRGESWTPAHTVEVIDVAHEMWEYTGDWAQVYVDGVVYGIYLSSSTPKDAMRLRFRGMGADILAVAGETPGSFRAWVDEGPVEQVEIRASTTQQLVNVWSDHSLDDAWHDLHVEVDSGSVAINAAQVWRMIPPGWEPIPFGGSDSVARDSVDSGSGEPDSGGSNAKAGRCGGCAVGGPGAWWTLLALIPALGRRRNPGARATSWPWPLPWPSRPSSRSLPRRPGGAAPGLV